MPFTWFTVRSGQSTPADLVQSRSSQIGPRSVSELESVLTLVHSFLPVFALFVFYDFSADDDSIEA